MKKNWDLTRQKGKENFILQTGLSIMCSFGVIFSLRDILKDISEGVFPFNSVFNMGFILKTLYALVFGFALGCFFGWLIWLWKEWRYSK